MPPAALISTTGDSHRKQNRVGKGVFQQTQMFLTQPLGACAQPAFRSFVLSLRLVNTPSIKPRVNLALPSLSVLLFGWLIVQLPFSPAAVLPLPNNRVFGEPPEGGKYVPSDGEVTVLIVVRKFVAELQGNMRDGRFLIELATSRQLIKHPLGYLLGCGHEVQVCK
jgi:hypothetical protein